MKRILAPLLLTVTMITSTFAFAEESVQEKTFKKGIFGFTYPDKGWALEELPPPTGKKSTNIKLTASGTPPLSIVLTWDDSIGELSEKDKEARSPVTASAFGLPIALSLAGNKSENIVQSVGLINLSDLSDLSARFTILKPGSPKTMNLDAFVLLPQDTPGNILMGAIISEGSQQQTDLTDEYYDRLYEAYGIVQTMAFKATK